MTVIDTDMTAPLTRAQLDLLTCQMPGCSHEHHDALVLNSQCHVRKPVVVHGWGDGVIELRCKICNAFTASVQCDAETSALLLSNVACSEPDCKEPIENHHLVMKPPCHPMAGAFVSYGDGHLRMDCAKCKRPIIAFHVAA